MNDKAHQPAYRAAFDTAHAELRQLADRMSWLHARHEQVSAAVEALKPVVSVSEQVDPTRRPSPKPVYTMSNPNPQPVRNTEKVQALA